VYPQFKFDQLFLKVNLNCSYKIGGLDFSCWAMSTYSSHSDFDEYHEQTGEICNYSEMKAEILEGISLTDAVHVTDFSEVDLDASWHLILNSIHSRLC
jgi:hypothetical protein